MNYNDYNSKLKKIYTKCNDNIILYKKLKYEEYLYDLIYNLIENNCDKRLNIKLHRILYEYDEKNLKVYYSQKYSSYRFEYKSIVNYLFKELKCRIDFIKINDKEINELSNNNENFKNILKNNILVKINFN